MSEWLGRDVNLGRKGKVATGWFRRGDLPMNSTTVVTRTCEFISNVLHIPVRSLD